MSIWVTNLHLDLYCQTAWHMLIPADVTCCTWCNGNVRPLSGCLSTHLLSVIATHNSHIDMFTCLHCRTANSYCHALPFDVLWFPTHQVQTKVKINKRLYCSHNTRNGPSIATPSGLSFRNGIPSPTITPTSLSTIKSDDDDDDNKMMMLMQIIWWCDDTHHPTVPRSDPAPATRPMVGWCQRRPCPGPTSRPPASAPPRPGARRPGAGRPGRGESRGQPTIGSLEPLATTADTPAMEKIRDIFLVIETSLQTSLKSKSFFLKFLNQGNIIMTNLAEPHLLDSEDYFFIFIPTLLLSTRK